VSCAPFRAPLQLFELCFKASRQRGPQLIEFCLEAADTYWTGWQAKARLRYRFPLATKEREGTAKEIGNKFEILHRSWLE
jgi:hypothetical protein